MANLSVVQRKVNKNSTLQPISIRYSHPDPTTGKSKDWFIAAGVTVDPKHFKKGAVVTHPGAPEANEKIREIYGKVERALRFVQESSDQVEPTVEYVKMMYYRLPQVAENLQRLDADWTAEGKSNLEIAEHELEDLLFQVEVKKQEIEKLKEQLGIDRPVYLFTHLLDEMVKKLKNLSQKTKDGYKQVKTEVNKFNSKLLITDITKETVEEFEKYLVAQEYYNNTTHTHIGRFIAVLNYYVDKLDLSKSYREYKFELSLKEDNVIYHTKEELAALRDATFTARKKNSVAKLYEVRDLALVMAETALRFSDSHIKETDIKNGIIAKRQQKTKQMVYIPLTNRVKTILERYNYNLKGKSHKNWNINYRKILAQLAESVPSLQEEITVINWIGDEEIPDTRPKWEHCSAHTLRRTMINQALLRGLKYHQVTRITGHKNFKTFETYINKNSRVEELDSIFDFLDDVPAMKVVA